MILSTFENVTHSTHVHGFSLVCRVHIPFGVKQNRLPWKPCLKVWHYRDVMQALVLCINTSRQHHVTNSKTYHCDAHWQGVLKEQR